MAFSISETAFVALLALDLGSLCGLRFRQQVLGVDEAAAGLAEALRRLLLAEAVDVDALFADARGEAREVAVRRDEAEAVETAAECSRSIASITSVMSEAFLPVV